MKRSGNASYYLAAAVALLTLLVYLPALENDFVTWDDNEYVLENPFIRSFNTVFFKWAFLQFFASNWHPLTWISHALDYAVWGLNPLGHHLASIVLHALNAFLVVMLVIKLLEAFRDRAPFLNERGILIAAGTTGLLFGLHPLHVESVAWVAERKDLLCALFFLLSLITYTKYVRSQKSEVRSQKSEVRRQHDRSNFFPLNRIYLVTVLFFILALLSKPMAVTLPVVLLILDWHPFGRIHSRKTFLTACIEKLPFFLLSLASSIITILAQGAGGAIQSTGYAPLSARMFIASTALMAYLGKMLLPLALVPYYPYPESGPLVSFEHIVSIVLVVGVTAVCAIIAKKQKLWPAAWGYYAMTLLPVIGIVQVGLQAMADRYTYLPSLGPFLVAGLGAAWVWDKAHTLKKPGPPVKLLGVTAACLALLLSYATVKQTSIWKNGIVLWSAVIEKYPTVRFAYNNRGMAYNKIGLFDRAIGDFDKAIALAPRDSEAYSNRGMLFGKTGQFDRAIEDLQKAIALSPSPAAAYNSRNTLGVVFAEAGLVDKAFEQFNKAIFLNQSYAMAYNNRGLLFVMTGDKERAASDFQKACDLEDGNGCNALRELIRSNVNSR